MRDWYTEADKVNRLMKKADITKPLKGTEKMNKLINEFKKNIPEADIVCKPYLSESDEEIYEVIFKIDMTDTVKDIFKGLNARNILKADYLEEILIDLFESNVPEELSMEKEFEHTEKIDESSFHYIDRDIETAINDDYAENEIDHINRLWDEEEIDYEDDIIDSAEGIIYAYYTYEDTFDHIYHSWANDLD